MTRAERSVDVRKVCGDFHERDPAVELGVVGAVHHTAMGLNGPPLPDSTASSVFVVDSQRLVTGKVTLSAGAEITLAAPKRSGG